MPSDDSVGFDLVALLDALEGVEFIVVGGVAVALHGGPRVTVDLDIVPDIAGQNVGLLCERLSQIDAIVREPGTRRMAITLELLRGAIASGRGGQLRIRTKLGPLDVLGRLHDGRGYDELLKGAVILSDDERKLRVIGIDDLIAVKADAGRPQDLEDVRYLEHIKSRM